MDAKTQQMIVTVGGGIAKKVLMLQAAGLVSHGVMSANYTEVYVSLGLALLGALWSFWNDFGKAIVLSQLEVLKAKSLAQAEKMRINGVTPVTVQQIANQSGKMNAADVAKAVETLPVEVKANIAPVATIVARVLLVAFALSFLLAGDPALAQGVKLGPIGQKVVSDIAGSTAAKPAAALDSIASVLAKPFQDIANFIGADADGAIALATTLPNLKDGHGQQCWIAMKSYGDIVKAHPIPVTFHIINDYEALRLLGIATNNLCSNVHCTQVFADFTAMAQAASPMPLAIPSLHDLCTKVPQIAVVDPVPVPVAPATPAAQ